MNASKIIRILSGVQGDTRRYRSLHLSEQLRLVNAGCTIAHITDDTAISSTSHADILILQRVTWDNRVARIIQEARSR
ncbi:MAG: hypothetical protein QXU75_09690, partial [Candidatus Methanomethylicaceae archaeon]